MQINFFLKYSVKMNSSMESIDRSAPSTPSSSSDYITGDGDDSSDSRGPVPCTLKSVENLLAVTKVCQQLLFNILYTVGSYIIIN